MPRHRQAPPWCVGNHHLRLGGKEVIPERDWFETDLTDEIEEGRQERFIQRCQDMDWRDGIMPLAEQPLEEETND